MQEKAIFDKLACLELEGVLSKMFSKPNGFEEIEELVCKKRRYSITCKMWLVNFKFPEILTIPATAYIL